jgi:ElaB/YqjD/DUF883 family membrane-anchored ribosome-binding protein
MRDGSAQIPRGLLGYRRRAVLRILDEREFVLRQAQERLDRADARLAELEEQLQARTDTVASMEKELDATREELERREGQLQEMWGRIASIEEQSPGRELSRIIHDELARVLSTAQQAAEQIIDRARSTAESHLSQARRTMAEAEVERARIKAWRDQAGPYVALLRTRLTGVRERVLDVPATIQQALELVGQGVAAVDAGLADVESLPDPPAIPEASSAFTGSAAEPAADPAGPSEGDTRVEVSSGEGDEGLRVIEWSPDEGDDQENAVTFPGRPGSEGESFPPETQSFAG